MSEWQPMATAPRDGTLIWLRSQHEIRVGAYGKHHAPWRWCVFCPEKLEDDELTDAWHDRADGDIPDGWMPLPAPPQP